MNLTRKRWSLLPVCLLPAIALAQGSAFRCVDQQGQVSYQQLPCPLEAEQRTVKVVDALPTLTLEEQFRAEAQRMGLTPQEYAERLEAAGQVWTPEGAASGEQIGTPEFPGPVPCVRPGGEVHFARPGTCLSARAVAPRAAAADSVRDADSNGFDAQRPLAPPAARGEPRETGAEDARDRCDQARQAAREARDSDLALSYAERSRLDDRVWSACRGR